MRQSAIVETSMTSVERVMEYGKLESEAPMDCEGDDELLWDEEVAIEFKDVSLKYAEGEPEIVKRVGFKIRQGEKVSKR